MRIPENGRSEVCPTKMPKIAFPYEHCQRDTTRLRCPCHYSQQYAMHVGLLPSQNYMKEKGNGAGNGEC